MTKAELLAGLEALDDDAEIEVIVEGECYEIIRIAPDWTSDDGKTLRDDNKRALIEVRY